jgi:hypothetical protein
MHCTNQAGNFLLGQMFNNSFDLTDLSYLDQKWHADDGSADRKHLSCWFMVRSSFRPSIDCLL